MEKTKSEMTRIGYSFYLDYDLDGFFDEAYLMTIKRVIERLNQSGRKDERITWEQGEAIPGKPFPLPPEYGSGSHMFIQATCRIPTANVKTEV